MKVPDDFSKLESRLTDAALASLEQAGLIAYSDNQSFVGTEHLLLGVLTQQSSVGARILSDGGVTLERVRLALDLTPQLFEVTSAYSGLKHEVIDAIKSAWQLSIEFGQEKIGTDHLVYSLLLARDSRVAKLLSDMSINIKSLKGEFEEVFQQQHLEATAETKQLGALQGDLKVLGKYGVDLTERAREKQLDPVVGRDREIDRLITILGRRSKSNPALIGEPGVGKTAIVEGLAQRIVGGQVPAFLHGRRLVRLDLSSLVAGAKYRGEFEERLQKIVAVLSRHQEIILFIDEMHLLVGAGASEGSMDAANALKPALARGEIRLIGATTFDEYRKYIEKDTALARRFQPIVIAEPDLEMARRMVSAMSGRLAQHHHVEIPEEIVSLSVELSDRYVSERQLPDKAIDVLDEASSLLKARIPARLNPKPDIKQQIAVANRQLDLAVEAEDYERAAECKMRLARLRSQSKSSSSRPRRARLTEDYLLRAISAITSIPLEKLSSRQVNSLVKLEDRLGQFIVGQAEAVSAVARAIKRSKSGLARQSGPMGSFVLLGPTGVGKTEMARVLAREVFGGDNSLIKIDMSEFGERHTASRLIGAPAGYIGYDDGGGLTDRVRRRPYSVVLFDEVEKAHPDVMNLLLQILEDGQLTDSHGRVVSFRQTIVILTSNIGAEGMVKDSELGFSSKDRRSRSSERVHIDNTREVTKQLEQFMKPELVGRFDEIVVFRPLTRPALNKIFTSLTKELFAELEKDGIKVVVSSAVRKQIVDSCLESSSGARSLRRAVQVQIGDRLSETLLAGQFSRGQVINIKLNKAKIEVSVEKN